MKPNFNCIASSYDWLAHLSFGSTWRQIQYSPIDFLEGVEQILIVGGGTGMLLERLPKGKKVVFLERSGEMIKRAKQRSTNTVVEFEQADIFEWYTERKFDAIILPFVLDCFDAPGVQQMLRKARQHLVVGGQLIVVDFQRGSRWQNTLVRRMYRFFRLVANLQTSRLPAIPSLLVAEGFVLEGERLFFKGWIFSRSYRT